MDQAVKTLTSEGSDARKWMGRIIAAVILGEAIWSLIVSVMNNLVVPWLGDVLGQSSGLPASFTQRPYDYPDLFVSIGSLYCGDHGGDPELFLRAAKVRKREGGEESSSDRAGRARRSGSSSRGGCGEDPGHVAGRRSSTTGDARSGYSSSTRSGSSGGAAPICLASETCDSCAPHAASCDVCGGKAFADRAKSRATQGEEAQRGVLQHCRRARAFRRRLAAKAEKNLA
jgi:hypothetical protein